MGSQSIEPSQRLYPHSLGHGAWVGIPSRATQRRSCFGFRNKLCNSTSFSQSFAGSFLVQLHRHRDAIQEWWSDQWGVTVKCEFEGIKYTSERFTSEEDDQSALIPTIYKTSDDR